MALKIVSKGEKAQRYSYMLRCTTRAMARAAVFIVMIDWYHCSATVERTGGEVIYLQDLPDICLNIYHPTAFHV
jgi:hypothetical protein